MAKTTHPEDAAPYIRGLAPLTDRAKAFVREYLVDWSGTAAAKRAGYSPHTAQQQATRLLASPLVQSEIRSAKLAISATTERSVGDIVRGLEAVAFAALPSETPHPLDVVRTADRLKALELLARYKGLFVERKEISGPDGQPIKIVSKSWVELMMDEDGGVETATEVAYSESDE